MATWCLHMGNNHMNCFKFGCLQPRASASAAKIMSFPLLQWAESFGEESELFWQILLELLPIQVQLRHSIAPRPMRPSAD